MNFAITLLICVCVFASCPWTEAFPARDDPAPEVILAVPPKVPDFGQELAKQFIELLKSSRKNAGLVKLGFIGHHDLYVKAKLIALGDEFPKIRDATLLLMRTQTPLEALAVAEFNPTNWKFNSDSAKQEAADPYIVNFNDL